uniref:Uncharacterized protein n=1 Tax=Strigamia maritima TaxID=126957 RepID=T1ITN1_STRMM
MDIVNVERLKRFNKRVDEPIDDMEPPQVEFAPEIETIDEQDDRKLETLREDDEIGDCMEIIEKFIDDNDQIFESENIKERKKSTEKERITLKHHYNLRERVKKPPIEVAWPRRRNSSSRTKRRRT